MERAQMAATNTFTRTNDTIIPRRNEIKSQIKQNHEFMSIQHQTTAPDDEKRKKKKNEER